MKNKNDFKHTDDLRFEVVEPQKCLHCGYTNLERIELSTTNGRPFIRRLMEKRGLSRFFPKQHYLHGWRCLDCGYVMWFTAKYLD